MQPVKQLIVFAGYICCNVTDEIKTTNLSPFFSILFFLKGFVGLMHKTVIIHFYMTIKQLNNLVLATVPSLRLTDEATNSPGNTQTDSSRWFPTAYAVIWCELPSKKQVGFLSKYPRLNGTVLWGNFYRSQFHNINGMFRFSCSEIVPVHRHITDSFPSNRALKFSFLIVWETFSRTSLCLLASYFHLQK